MPVVFKISEFRPSFLIKGDMIAYLPNVEKAPDDTPRFTIRRIILIVEDKKKNKK